MSATSRAAVALILTLLGRSLRAQSAADTSLPRSTSTIDAATAVRERGARSLSEVLTSGAPGLLVVPGSGENGMGARIRPRGVQSLVADRAPLVLVDGMRIATTEDAFSPGPPSNGYVYRSGFDPPRPPGPLRLDDLNPDDVESMGVLPGPAARAPYRPGARGGGGAPGPGGRGAVRPGRRRGGALDPHEARSSRSRALGGLCPGRRERGNVALAGEFRRRR